MDVDPRQKMDGGEKEKEKKRAEQARVSFGMSGEKRVSEWWKAKAKAHAHARTRTPACLYAHHQAPAAETSLSGPHLDAPGPQ
jgi:hypothetical protein